MLISLLKLNSNFKNVGSSYTQNATLAVYNPVPFDFEKKYTLQEINNIKFIKIRLCDSYMWGQILTQIFKIEIIIIDDYQTDKKPIGAFYKRFKEEYRLPENYVDLIKN